MIYILSNIMSIAIIWVYSAYYHRWGLREEDVAVQHFEDLLSVCVRVFKGQGFYIVTLGPSQVSYRF